MVRIKLKRGRKGIPLGINEKNRLMVLAQQSSVVEIAKRIGISRNQLYYPLTGLTNCSPESHRKITRWLERNAK